MFRSLLRFAAVAAFPTAVGLKLKLLNDPEQKIATRVKTLKNLRVKMESMEMNGLLADQKPNLEKVMHKIDDVLKLNDETQAAKKTDHKGEEKKGEEMEKKLDEAIQEVQKDINDLKAQFMKKAMELEGERTQQMEQLKGGGQHASSAEQKRDQLFDKLMEVQDAPKEEQLKILREAAKDDPFVDKFLKKHEGESEKKDADNLAMEFGKALDGKTEDEKKEAEAAQLGSLEKDAKLNENQAKSLLPILTKIKSQKADKDEKLHDLDGKLREVQETERSYKKHRAVLNRESEVLGEAVDAVEHGQIKKLTKAMGELKDISSR